MVVLYQLSKTWTYLHIVVFFTSPFFVLPHTFSKLEIREPRERPFFLWLLATTRTACYFDFLDNFITWLWGLLQISVRERPFFLL